MKLAIVGAGIAGTACAWAASRAGAEVILIGDRSGASELYPGVVDLEPWERGTHASPPAEVAEFAKAFWVLEPCRVVTPAGVVRTALGRDAAILDLSTLAGKHVAVADVIRDDWDGQLVVRSLAASETAARFSLVPLPLVRANERSISAWDFAHAFDDEKRLLELCSAIDERKKDYDAWLLGPWLGTRRSVFRELRERVGVPIGESTSQPGGAAGARFEEARAELVGKLDNVTHVRARVLSVEQQAVVTAEDRLAVDRVIIAAGGVAAGGIVLDGPRFGLSFQAPLTLELDGQPIDAASTQHGIDFAARGLGTLERIGVRAENGVFAAGDIVANRTRTMLEAIASALRAVERALG
jgi:anaerobic glycerol-3-phosphate dehydrogenase